MTSNQIAWNNNQDTFTAYERSVDAGNGTQLVLVHNGTIVEQSLHARHGRYTGDGNPEIVGKPLSTIRGWGFSRIRGTRLENLCDSWLRSDAEEEEEEED